MKSRTTTIIVVAVLIGAAIIYWMMPMFLDYPIRSLVVFALWTTLWIVREYDHRQIVKVLKDVYTRQTYAAWVDPEEFVWKVAPANQDDNPEDDVITADFKVIN